MKTFHYAIGDIHGCFAELLEMERQLLDHARRHNANAQFFCVGDYVDRGLAIRQVLEHLFFSPSAPQYTLIAGNHEAMMMDVLVLLFPEQFPQLPEYLFSALPFHSHPDARAWGFELLEHWYSQGGDRTARSLFGSMQWQRWSIPWKLIQRLAQLPLLASATEAVLLTHALVSDEDLRLYANPATRNDPIRWRQCVEGFLWRRGTPTLLHACRLHISGHTPMERPLYLPERHRLLLDTGCVYGNGLSAFCIDTEEFFFVEAQRRYW